MAKLNEDIIVIKVSELVKDSEDTKPIFDKEIEESLEAVVQELVGTGKLVEIIKE